MKNLVDVTSMAELMTMAIDDMEALIDNPRYSLTSSVWHEPRGEVCHVCLAGSVMATRLNAKEEECLLADSYEYDVRTKLFSIENLREGYVGDAYAYFNGSVLGHRYDMDDIPCQNFDDDTSACQFVKFWRDIGIPRLEQIDKDYA